MTDESLGITILFLEERILEVDCSSIVMLSHELTAGVDLAAIGVLVPPAAGQVEIFHGKTERIELGVTTGAIGMFAVFGKLFADGHVL